MEKKPIRVDISKYLEKIAYYLEVRTESINLRIADEKCIVVFHKKSVNRIQQALSDLQVTIASINKLEY